MTTDVHATVETYYDAAPRLAATVVEVGPFTLFVKDDPSGFDYCARPRLGLDAPIDVTDVPAVRARQRVLGVPENLEWMHQTTPSLLGAARATGLSVEDARGRGIDTVFLGAACIAEPSAPPAAPAG